MLGRLNRFHGHNSLRFVYQNGHTVRGPLTSLKYAENSRRSAFRVAVVISKKVCKSAVKRNRMRRRLLAVIRSYSSKITAPYDLVFTVFHEQIIDITPTELDKLVRAQLKQARVIA